MIRSYLYFITFPSIISTMALILYFTSAVGLYVFDWFEYMIELGSFSGSLNSNGI